MWHWNVTKIFQKGTLEQLNCPSALIACWHFWRATNKQTDGRTVGRATLHYMYASRICHSTKIVQCDNSFVDDMTDQQK